MAGLSCRHAGAVLLAARAGLLLRFRHSESSFSSDRNAVRWIAVSFIWSMAMRSSNWTPSIVPGDDQDVCLVIADLGQLGQVYREADVDAASFDIVVADLLDGQYAGPLRVISFNTAEGWSRDISAQVAIELLRRCDLEMRDIRPPGQWDQMDIGGTYVKFTPAGADLFR
jgi:hypothetical protein